MAEAGATSFEIVRGYLPGTIGRIAELHAAYYHKAHGFGLAFEQKVARELGDFCLRIDSARDGLWLLRRDDHIEGAIVIDGVHASSEGAHLRWFIISDSVRGQGHGAELLSAAMAHCRVLGFTRVYLWTFEGLDAARHLYEQVGFRLTQAARGSQWGREVTEQRFEARLDLLAYK